MLHYVTDGSLEGLFCAIDEAMASGSAPDFIAPEDAVEGSLFIERFRVKTEPSRAAIFAEGVATHAGTDTLSRFFYCWLSEESGITGMLVSYAKLAFKMGPSVIGHVSDPVVLAVQRCCQRVTHESHRLKGLVRFSELKNGLLYAPIEPDHDVTALLASHFQKRLRGIHWMIHDVKRGIAAVSDGKSFHMGEVEAERAAKPEDYSPEEMETRALWKEFFRTIAIAERKNPGLQRKNMPQRYWKYLTEME
jgi:probable DNA metabolism protein